MVAKLKPVASSKRKKTLSKLPASKKKVEESQDEDKKTKKKRKSDIKTKAFYKAQKAVETQYAGEDLEEGGFGEETKYFLDQDSSDDDLEDFDGDGDMPADGRLRMRANIALEDSQYVGKRSSRKSIFEEEGGSDSDQKSEEDGSDSDENSEEDDGEPKWNQEKSWESDETFEDYDTVDTVQYEAQDEEMEALDKEYRDLEAQEEEMLKGLKGHTEDDVQKGQAVRCQKKLWDNALETRILLQKHFSNSNRLPSDQIRSSMIEANAEVRDAYAKLTATSIETLGCITETLKALLEQNVGAENVYDDIGVNEKERENSLSESSDEAVILWEQMTKVYSRFIPFRNNSVDRWQRKTQLSSGAAASKTKLRAFNQSISQQIENHMRDTSRVLRRMWLRKSSVDVIGIPTTTVEQNPDVSSNDGQDVEAENKDDDGDPELIDDTEFYQELLREFLESSDPASVGNLYAVRKLRNKKRKVVDRRASKGRKIRYNIHDKIVNFMVPLPVNMPPMAEKLFTGGLFQAKVNRL